MTGRAELQADCEGAVRMQLERLVRSRACAGLQYLATVNGEIAFECCVGLANAAGGVPVTPATNFNLYSITKVLTAATVIRAAGTGALHLGSPIAVATGASELSRFGTLHDTLLHRGGFPNPMPLRWFHRSEEHTTFDESAFVDSRLQALSKHRPRPGRYRYSNVGYLAVGRALERAHGRPLREQMEAVLLDDLRRAEGSRLGFEIPPRAHYAPGHVYRRGLLGLTLGWWVDRRRIVDSMGPAWVQLHPHHVDGSAYGGLIGNARGLAAFGHAAMGITGGWDPGMRERMSLPVAGAGPGRTLAWFTGRLGEVDWLAHAGGGLGGYGELRVYPALRAVSVLLTNGPGLRDRRALDSIDGAWIARTADCQRP